MKRKNTMLADDEMRTIMPMPPGDNPSTTRKSHSIFYKFIDRSILHQKELDMPRRFTEIHGDELLDVVYLTASTPGMWPVYLRKDKQKAWFHGGWQKFVADQSICAGCFLVFKYEGNSKFHVDIYNLATTKDNFPRIAPLTLEEIAGGIRFRLPYKKDDLDDNICIVDYHTSCATSSFSLKNVYDDIHQTSWSNVNGLRQSSSTTCFQADNSPIMLQKMAVATRDIGIQLEEKELTKNNPKELGVGSPLSSQAKRHCGKRKAIAEPEADRDEFQAENVSIGVSSAKVSSRSSPSRFKAERTALVAASYFKSNHPFVSVFMKPTYVSSFVYLPSWFVLEHLQGLSGNIKLLLDGILWPAELIHNSNHNGLIRKGWPAFARDNNLEEGDVCVFELVNKIDVVLKVSIFRSADYMA